MHSASDRGGDTISERGRSTFRNGNSKGKKEKNERSNDTVFTLASAPRRTRPLLSEVFGSGLDSDFPACPEVKVGHEKVNGAWSATENGLNGSLPAQEYELKTDSISKTKQSLGVSSSSFSNHAPEEIQTMLLTSYRTVQ